METAKVTGPLFDGRAEKETQMYCAEVEKTIAEEGAAQIRAYLPGQYKYLGHGGGTPQDNPVPPNAGFYENSITTNETAEGYLITDSDVIYGPWLEGVSDRNRATRFPGYGAFRKISQELDADAGKIAGEKLPPFIAAMNT